MRHEIGQGLREENEDGEEDFPDATEEIDILALEREEDS